MSSDPEIDVDRVAALLFDLGGVVFHFDFGRAHARWAAAAGMDAGDVAARFVADDAYERFERGQITTGEYWERLRSVLGVDLTDEVLLDGWNCIFGEVISGMPDLLTASALAFPVWALSNTNAAHAAVWPGLFGDVLSLFAGVLVTHDIGHRKPEAPCYMAAAGAMGVEPARVLFFDDLVANVEGARAVGMQAVHVRHTDDVRVTLRTLGVAVDLESPPAAGRSLQS